MIDRGARYKEFGNQRTAEGMRPSEGQDSPVVPIMELLGDALHQVECSIQETTRSRFEDVDRLSGQAATLGGKRLRPTLALLSSGASVCGKVRDRRERDLIAIAAAVELVHAASLVHDDVMDHAELRRHRPTLGHIEGNSAAILLGDFLFTRAYGLAATCQNGFPARQIARASSELCEGELRQQATVGRWDLRWEDYCDILNQKTGALCGVACRLGVWAAGGSKEQARALGRYGRLLGVAFQIFDDWLDYWGTQRVGKTLGTDWAQRKPTLPLLRALRQGPAPIRTQLQAVLDTPDQDGFGPVRELLEKTDAGEFTLAMAQNHIKRAIDALGILPDSKFRQGLVELAEFSVGRAN